MLIVSGQLIARSIYISESFINSFQKHEFCMECVKRFSCKRPDFDAWNSLVSHCSVVQTSDKRQWRLCWYAYTVCLIKTCNASFVSLWNFMRPLKVAWWRLNEPTRCFRGKTFCETIRTGIRNGWLHKKRGRRYIRTLRTVATLQWSLR